MDAITQPHIHSRFKSLYLFFITFFFHFILEILPIKMIFLLLLLLFVGLLVCLFFCLFAYSFRYNSHAYFYDYYQFSVDYSVGRKIAEICWAEATEITVSSRSQKRNCSRFIFCCFLTMKCIFIHIFFLIFYSFIALPTKFLYFAVLWTTKMNR